MSKDYKGSALSLSKQNSHSSVFTSTFFSPKRFYAAKLIFSVLFFGLFCGLTTADSQTIYQPNYFTANQPTNNYMANSSAFKQEIARMEINVVREGEAPLPLTQVPRLQKDDRLTVRLLDEQVNGMKPDQSNWDWTFLVAFVNPARNNEKEKSVSEEIQFRKSGWYKEYSFVVPYDSQPIFFLYSKPKYRNKILSLINKNQEEIRKIGEKTLELSGAYAKIGSFLNELQYVVNTSSYGGFGGYYGGYGNSYGGGGYGGYGSYGNYGNYGNYGGYGSTYGGIYNGATNPTFNLNLFMNQAVERLARSFNIQLPQCWQSYGFSTYGASGNQNNLYGINPDFIGRSQCVARSVRFEDFDLSVSRMLQQGGIFGAAQLAQKYPQLAFWINVAAAALDFILKLSRKAALRIVPTVVSTSDNQGQGFSYQNNFTASSSYSINSINSGIAAQQPPEKVKISLFAEAPPNDNGFVTAYPLVLQKWQANPDPEVLSLPMPVLLEQCLHAGQNILKSTDLMNDWMADNFSRDFKLVVSSPNGFRKEFPLKKNVGLGGWELNITREDLNSFPKINMTLESVVVGKRGFKEIKSPQFNLPIPVSGSWEVEPQSQKAFAVGEKRIVTLQNALGNCRCLQAVIYKPSFGGQFVFEAGSPVNGLMFSADNKRVSFEIDAANFQPGQGQLELRQIGGETTNLNITLYPAPPIITNFKAAKGDTQIILTGERLEQIQAVEVNGRRAASKENNSLGSQSAIPSSYTSNLSYSPISSEKTFVFTESAAQQDSNPLTLKLELEGSRVYQYPKTFSYSASRPVIVANAAKEIEGSAVGSGSFNNPGSPFFPTQVSEIVVTAQNALTDYDFKVENISLETRIENSQINSNELLKADFDVLDWKSIRLSFKLNEQSKKLLAGRRMQFRIRDKERGDSDWYTIGKTFARIPEISLIKCSNGAKGNCEMRGEGIEYISQISVDGGKTWFPQEPATLTVQTALDGSKVVVFPYYSNKSLLKIRLRDFPSIEGFSLDDYSFTSTGKGKN